MIGVDCYLTAHLSSLESMLHFERLKNRCKGDVRSKCKTMILTRPYLC